MARMKWTTHWPYGQHSAVLSAIDGQELWWTQALGGVDLQEDGNKIGNSYVLLCHAQDLRQTW